MFYNLFYPLVEYVSAFNIFQYITFRMAYAAVTAFLIAFLFGPKVIKWLKVLKYGQEVRQDGPQSHAVKQGTPTMGGALMLFGIVISCLLWMDLTHHFTWMFITAALGFGGLGLCDDLLKIVKKNSKGLPSQWKMLGQLIISFGLLLWIYLLQSPQSTFLYLPFLKFPLLNLDLLYIPFGMVWLVGFSNAVNLTDGLDGLASGLMIIVALALALMSYVSGRPDFAGYLQIPFIPGGSEIAIGTLAIVGALVGFLWYNAHPADVFMGDTGSLALGGLIGLISLLIKKEILLIVLGGVFVLETLSVIIQVIWFKRTGKRVFRMAPLHHHFELSGWSETKVVTRFWILGGLFAIISLSTLKIQ